MNVVWSPLAMDRVRDAADTIARDKPGAAVRWAEGLFSAAERLARFPNSGRVPPELGRADVREVIHGSYRIIYRRTPETVLILTVRHGSRLVDGSEIEERAER